METLRVSNLPLRMTANQSPVILSEAKDLYVCIMNSASLVSRDGSASHLSTPRSTLHSHLIPIFIFITRLTSSEACMNAAATFGSKWLPAPSSMMAMAFSKGKPSL